MKNSIKILFSLILVLFATTVFADNQNIYSKGSKAKNVNHFGDVWLSHVSRADEYYNYNVAVAEFAPGARLNWHLHPAGQQLIVVEGEGYYQERNAPVQLVKKGDVIKCAPGVEHWHAATPTSAVSYIAITGNEATQWLEPVSEKFYLEINSNTSKK